jgi:hypothetical protein
MIYGRQNPLFLRGWNIIQVEIRVAGEWEHKSYFRPGERTLCFWPSGIYHEFIPTWVKKGIESNWTYDDETGIISIEHEADFVETCVFCNERGVFYLYFFDNQPHIPPDPEVIIEHHADRRWRVERV